jgi:hypothetical protein
MAATVQIAEIYPVAQAAGDSRDAAPITNPWVVAITVMLAT